MPSSNEVPGAQPKTALINVLSLLRPRTPYTNIQKQKQNVLSSTRIPHASQTKTKTKPQPKHLKSLCLCKDELAPNYKKTKHGISFKSHKNQKPTPNTTSTPHSGHIFNRPHKQTLPDTSKTFKTSKITQTLFEK